MSRVFILGGAQTDFERNWTKEGKNVIALLKEVMTDALVQVGLSFSDLEELNKNNRVACFVGNFIAENYINHHCMGFRQQDMKPPARQVR